jgi:superfamily II DNA/RNA helicase
VLVRGIAAASSPDVPESAKMEIPVDSIPSVDLHSTCWEGLKRMSISSLFPVQKICTYLVLNKNQNPQYSPFDCDLCVAAPTGSGKSLAYLLPIIHSLADRNHPVLRALIVLPTRDLALQISSVASAFAGLRVQTLVGQQSMSEERQALSKGGCDIAVATMGRLIDHLVIGTLDLSYLRWLVVDEADRMLSKSDLDKWALILNTIPDTAQRLLFSATMTSNPLKLNKLKLTRPLFVSVGASASSIDHKYIVLPNKSVKARCMLKVLEYIFEGGSDLIDHTVKRCLILCRTSANVESLTQLLTTYLESSTIAVKPFSGNMNGERREKLLRKFANGSVQCLVSTDVITRGIDIPDIDVVVNYDVPQHATTYVHRAGRTGRANKTGLVVTLAEKKEMRHFRKEVLSGRNDVKRFNIDFDSLIKHHELEALAEPDDESSDMPQ